MKFISISFLIFFLSMRISGQGTINPGSQDTTTKSVETIVRTIIMTAGTVADPQQNISPNREDEERPAKERTLTAGDWLKKYAETIYGTRKSFMEPTDWGVAVEKGDLVYLHITNPNYVDNAIYFEKLPFTILKAASFETGKKLKVSIEKENGGIILGTPVLNYDAPDNVIVLKVLR